MWPKIAVLIPAASVIKQQVTLEASKAKQIGVF